MADLSITAADVVAADGAVSSREYIAGATIAAGDLVYIDTANDNVLKLAQADGTALEATVLGIAMCGASTGQPCIVAVSGNLDIGASLTVGQVYILSTAAGKICPVSDLASSSFCSIIGVGTASDNLYMNVFNSGAEKA
jgi:hypothetical protein